MRVMLALITLCMAAASAHLCAAESGDLQLIGRWCAKEVTLHLADGTLNREPSNESQYIVETFTADRINAEWVRQSQSERWIESYVAVAPGEIAVKMLEHSSLPSLVGSSSVVRYEVQGQTLKLTAFPQQMKPRPASTHRMIESTWVRCPQ